MKKILVLATGVGVFAWLSPEHASLAKVWAEVVFADQEIVDTGHPGAFELATVPPTKLAHIHHQYEWVLGSISAIDDRPPRPMDRYRASGGMRMDRSPGFDGHTSTSLRADELRRALRID